MPRARRFDADEARQIATDIFWRKGYDGASISELTAAMGISPPSFYAAFGSKSDLFQTIIESYQGLKTKLVEDALIQQTIPEIIESLLRGYIDLMTEPGRAPGCLTLNSSLPVIDRHPFRKRFAEEREALKNTLQKRFEELLQADDGIVAEVNPAVMAQLVVSMIWGLAVEAQSGCSRALLRETAAALCAGRAFGATKPTPSAVS